MRTLAVLKLLRLPLLGISVLAVLLAVLWSVQQNNVNSLKQQINVLKEDINKLPATVDPKKQLEQPRTVLEQQIDSLPATVATKKQLSQQMTALKQQIDTLPATIALKDRLILEKDRLTLEKDRVNAQNAIYGTLVQALGGAFFFVTAWLTWLNVKVAEEKQVTERFSKAIELLGNEKLEIRLGGIYALERIAKDSPKDHWTIMEVLISFAQEKSPLSQNIQQRDEQSGSSYPTQEKPKITTDVQAVLTVIGRRNFNKEQDEQRIELPRTKLKGANLTNADLTNADLTNADLTNADLTNADLTKANLTKANLTKATLTNANLTKANLTKFTLADADISEADFTGVYSNEARDKYEEAKEQADYKAYKAEKDHENDDYYQQYDSGDEEQYLYEHLKSEEYELLKNEISKAKAKAKAKGKPKLPDYLQ